MDQHIAMRGRFLAKSSLEPAQKKREERSIQVGNLDDFNVLDDSSIVEMTQQSKVND